MSYKSKAHNIMTFNRLNPYNDLPDLPPVTEIEPKEVLRRAIVANRAQGGMSIT